VNALPLIEAKRDGKTLSEEQIHSVVGAFTRREIPDYQMAALLMAILFRGLHATETRALTMALRDSGQRLVFPGDPRPLVDKHSTGGVGDKVSLVLAPLLACLGFRVPMISGRGLGITGGTLDKLESISRYNTALPVPHIIRQIQEIGCVICGQSDDMVPADKVLYALRDVTATVPSVPLITASILSKKLSESLDCLLLDVKFGAAAFMQTEAQARELATSMVRLANECGVKTRALLTGMNVPLGRAAGNLLEVREAVECLEGRGPADLEQLVVESAGHLLLLAGEAQNIESARSVAVDTLRSRKPLAKWEQMLAAQGVDIDSYHKQVTHQFAPAIVEVGADRDGCLQHCDARVIGEVVRDLGGGRMQKDSPINPLVGVDQIVQVGERVARGSALCRIHAASTSDADVAATRVRAAFAVADSAPARVDLVSDVIT
jgi:pyrimidine-nucleoside phosphorylase